MDFRELETDKLRCECGNETDFLIIYNGEVVLHIDKQDELQKEDWEEPSEEIRRIICLQCDKDLIPEDYK
jgi:hypothetical protein